jgi:tetratricopeptide (TPR) repeat protein
VKPTAALRAESQDLYAKGLYPAARERSRLWTEAAASEYGPESAQALEARLGHARAISAAGYFPEAEAYARELLEVMTRVKGETATEVLETEDVIGLSILFQGRGAEAAEFFDRLYLSRSGYLPDTDMETVVSARNRIRSRREAGGGEPGDADLYRGLLALQSATYGENDPEDLETELQLANVMYEQGAAEDVGDFDFTELDAMIERIVAERVRLYGEIHPDVSEAMALEGFVWQAKRKLPESKKVLMKVSEIEGKTLGPDHPWSVNSYLSLAWTEAEDGNGDAAVAWYRKAIASRLAFFGGESAKSCEARVMLSVALANVKEDYDAAREELLKVVQWREANLGQDHAETLTALTDLAGIYELQGQLTQSTEIYGRVLRSRTSTLGPDHPDTIQSSRQIAFQELLAGNLKNAKELYQGVLSRSESALGADHPETVNARVSLALALNGLGEYAEATRLLEQSLETLTRLKGPEHADTLAVRSYLVTTISGSGEKDRALRAAVDLLEAREKALGENHEDTQASRYQLAFIFIERKDWASALPLLEKVSAWQIEALGADSPATLNTRSELARAYRNLGERASARAAYTSLVRDTERVFGKNNPATIRLRNELALVF